MTSTISRDDSISVDSDLVDVGRRLWRGVLAAVVIGVVVGGLLGAIAAHLGSRSYQATTSLSVLPDPVLNTTQNDNSDTVSQDATAFIQSELVVLNGAQLANQVRADLHLNYRPDVTSTQLGESYVVQVTSSAPTRKAARQIATVTARDYARLRSRQLTAEVHDLQASTTRQVNTVLTQLNTARKNRSAKAAPTPSQTALQTEYEALLAVRGQLANTPVAAGSVVRVLTTARLDTPTLSSAEKDALVGALIGALLALTVLGLRRRSVPRLHGVSDLAAVGAPVVLPALTTGSVRAARSPAAPHSRDARLLAARLRTDVVAAGSLLVVAGTDAACGGRDVAVALAANLVDRRPVLLVSEGVRASDVPGGSDPEALTGPVNDHGRFAARPPSDGQSLHSGWFVADDLSELDEGGNGGDRGSRDGHTEVAHASTVPGLWLAGEPRANSDGSGGDVRSRAVGALLQAAVAAGWLVVLDAPSLAESALAVDCLDDAGVLALVVGRGRTRPGDLAGALDICDARGVPVAGVVLNDAGGTVRRFLKRVNGSRPLPALAEPVQSVAVTSPPWRSTERPVSGPGQHRPSPSANGRQPGHATRVRR